MAVTTLPLRSDGYPDYSFSAELAGATYQLALRWNDREQAWFLDLSSEDGVEVLMGAKVVLNWPLLKRLVGTTRPLGELVAVATQPGASDPPQLTELGQSVILTFVPEE